MNENGYPPAGSEQYQGVDWTRPAPTSLPPLTERRTPPRRRRSRGFRVTVVIGLLVVAILLALAAAGIAHLVDPSTSFVITRAPAATSGGTSSTAGGSSLGAASSSTPTSGPLSSSDVAAAVDPGIVDINVSYTQQGARGAGTGIVLTPTGVVLTNNHVIKGATSISVTDVGNGQTYSADVVGYDRSHDVAVIQLQNASGLPTAPIGDSSTVSVGDTVTALGNAGGVGGTPHVAPGQVTDLNQTITASDEGGGDAEQLQGLIQTDAPIQPGDSGGPLVNDAGQVVGMDAAASASNSYASQQVASEGYAIAINDALDIAKQIEDGQASATVHVGPTAFLGVALDTSGQSAGGYGPNGGYGYGQGGGAQTTQGNGALLGGVQSGTPAEKAGLAQGDTIVAVDGTTVTSADDLTSALSAHHPGDSVQLQWLDSSGQTHSASVTLASGPPA